MKLIGTLVLFFAAIPALAGAQLSIEQLLLVAQTNSTHLDLNGDGTVDLIRRYNTSGELVESTWTDSSKKPARIEHYLVSGDKRTRTTTFYNGTKLEKRIVERFSSQGKLVRRDTTDKTGLASELLSPLKTRVIIYELTQLTNGDSSWIYKRSYMKPSIFFDNDAEPGCPAPAPSIIDGLGQNMAAAGPAPKGSDVVFGNGFRMDGETCKDHASRERIKEATDMVVNHYLPCLARHNPNMAKKMADMMAKRKPRVRCLMQNPTPVLNDICRGESGAVDYTCVAERRKLASPDGPGAFFAPDQPDDFVLVNHDPVGAPPYIAPRVASAMFHEMIHQCGHTGAPDHNEQAHLETLNDEVYGCHLLCTNADYDQGKVHKESCEACIAADGNTPSAESQSACSKLMPVQIVQPIIGMRRLHYFMQDCAAGKRMNCESKKENKLFEVCESKSLKLGDPQCQALLREAIRKGIAEVEQMPGFDASKAGFNWAQFKASYAARGAK